MGNELTKVIKQNEGVSSTWDSKRVTGLVFRIGIFVLLGYLFTTFILPWLLTMVWGLTNLIIGCVVLAFVVAIAFNPKFWRFLRYSTEAISQWLLGWMIEMNPFNILQMKIDQARKDRETLRVQGEKLKGQQDSLEQQINEKDTQMQQSSKAIEIVKRILLKSPEDENANANYEIKVNEFQNAKNFIDGIKPVYNSICKLVVFADKAYKKSGIALTTAENTLTTQRALYDAVTTGSATMARAMRAFSGDPNLNSDADLAVKALQADISNKIGSIKTAINITSQAMDKQDLESAAKTELAAGLAARFDDSAFDYSSTINDSRIETSETSNNKYLELLNKK